MKTEIEAKFLNVDVDDIRAKLTALGATLEQPMRLMRRALIQTTAMGEDGRNSYIRLRDEGDKVTLTYKSFEEQTLRGTKEIETTVGDYGAVLAIFAQADLISRSFQECRRETWYLGGVTVVLDEWPWIQPYIEVESDSEEAVQAVAHHLGCSWDDAVFGGVDWVYKMQYPNMDGRGLIDLPIVRFQDPIPNSFHSEGV